METLKFLVIDDNTRSRLLVVATLARNFPHAVITEASTIKDAFAATDVGQMDAVVGFFGNGPDACVFAQLIRSQHSHVPIVIMAEVDCADKVLSAGATRFLGCDEWLTVGAILREIFSDSPAQHERAAMCTKKPPVETGGLEVLRREVRPGLEADGQTRTPLAEDAAGVAGLN